MKNKKGFVFIETIVVITILSVALLSVYSTFTSSYLKEQKKVYYDEISHVYRGYYVAKYLFNNSNAEAYFLDNTSFSAGYLAITFGPATSGLFKNSTQQLSFSNLYSSANVSQIIAVKAPYSDTLKCVKSTKNDFSDVDSSLKDKCSKSYGNVSLDIRRYMSTLSPTNISNYILIFKFTETKDGKACSIEKGCVNYYAWLDSGVKSK
jgi:prepilin-type N-terminal cleavage/methylation domain-containing protein